MALNHHKTKAYILLSLIVALPSVTILYTYQPNPTDKTAEILVKPSYPMSRLAQKHTPSEQTLDINIGGVPQRVGDSSEHSSSFHTKQTQRATLNTQKQAIVGSKNTTCGPVHVVFLPGNWIDATDNGYQTQDCDVPCHYTRDTSHGAISEADAVVVYLPTHFKHPNAILRDYGINRRNVLKVGMTMESSKAHPHQFDHISEYDIEMSYRMSSHVPDPYFTFARGKQNLLEASNSTWESREKAVLFVARNCKSNSGREKLVSNLQKYIRVDSVSSCMPNRQWPSNIPRTDKRALLRRYIAMLAAENSIERDYVTEKVYAGLITGAVPIYYGAPNIDKFVPTDSLIKVPHPLTDEGVATVAQRIQSVFNSKDEYNRLTRFKRLGTYEHKFLETFNFTRVDVKCRLCQKIQSIKCT